MRARSIFALGLFLAASMCATTLEQLSLDDMIQKSTAIVRAKVTGTYSASRGSNIWTFYRLQIIETLKPSKQTFTEVAVPGGVAGGVRQTVDGAPPLTVGQEQVLFVWVGASGLPQLIGLSQGLFSVSKDASGNIVLTRPAAAERMLAQNGQPVDDQPMGIQLTDLRSRVRKLSGAGK
jgi:hypothetical protein